MIEPGDDPEVIRAKYFIRDEFLVSSANFLLKISFFLKNRKCKIDRFI